jgi:magnesium transporter
MFEQVREHLREVINQDTPLGIALWNELIKAHPADIARFYENCDEHEAQLLFLKTPESKRFAVFRELSKPVQIFCLSFLSDYDLGVILRALPIDELTDLFDGLSDDELKKYLKLLHKKDREQVLSLLQFNPESAGGIMDSNVLTLFQDFTIEQSIVILQRLQPNSDLHRRIFITNHDNELVGFINLEDLVLKHPKTRIRVIMHQNDLVVLADEDRESVAKKMRHYDVMIVPVVDKLHIFLGVIPNDTILDVLEKESSEDVYRMAALSPMKYTYFQTSFYRLFFQRGSVLIVLLMLQTFSTLIIEHYEILLAGFLTYFMGMLTSTGGNASSQTSALLIQGLATGEIDESNSKRFLLRELLMAGVLALVLGVFGFLRVYLLYSEFQKSLAVSISLAVIVFVSMVLGGCMPLILKKFHLDPAHSAGPVLATFMDIIGIFLYCTISRFILMP